MLLIIQCLLCFSNVTSTSDLVLLTNCGHVFCKECIGRHIDHFGQCPICDRRIQDRHPAFLDVKIPLEPNGRCSEVANKNKNNNNVIQEAKAIMQGWVDATLNAKGFMDTPTTPNTMWCCNCEAQVPKKQFSKRELKSGFPSCRIHAED